MTVSTKYLRNFALFTVAIFLLSGVAPSYAQSPHCGDAVLDPIELADLNERECDLVGKIIRLTDGSELRVPVEGHGVVMSNARPLSESGIEEAELMTDPSGGVALVVDGVEFGAKSAIEYFDAGASVLGAASTGCSNYAYALLGRRWGTSTYSWWYNSAGQAVSGLSRISAGISKMASGTTRCGITVSNAAWYNGASTTGCAGNLYDLQILASHEAGHAFGLAHVAQTTEQIMKPNFGYCETAGRALGRGDAQGMKVLFG